MHSLNPKQGNQKAKSETKETSQLQLRNKSQSSAPTEGGKSTGKPPLAIWDYVCSRTRMDIVAFSQIYDSLQKPPKHLMHLHSNNNDEEKKQVQSSRSTGSKNGRTIAKIKIGTPTCTGNFIYPYCIKYEALKLIPYNQQKYSNKRKLEPNLQSPKANQTWMLMCTMQLTEPRGGTRQPSDNNPKALDCYTDEIAASEVVKQNWFQQSHETNPQGKHNLTLLQNQLMCFNNKQKMPWISKTYKLYTNFLKHLKLTRVNVLILAHLETSNKELKFGKDKDHSKYYQDGLTKDSYPSKPGLQPTHFKKYASLQTFVNSHHIASKPKSKQKKQ